MSCSDLRYDGVDRLKELEQDLKKMANTEVFDVGCHCASIHGNHQTGLIQALVPVIYYTEHSLEFQDTDVGTCLPLMTTSPKHQCTDDELH